MTKIRLFASVATSLTLTILAGSAALANGGGGSGGSSAGGLSASAPAYDPVVEYRSGVAALQASNYKLAVTEFDKVLAVSPDDANSLLLKGMAQTGLNDLKGAQKSYQAAVNSNSKLVAPRRELALTDVRLGLKSDAQKQRDTLQSQATKCKDTCAEAADLKAALAAVDAAMAGSAPKPSAMLTPGPLFGASQGDGAYLRAVSLINDHRYQDAITSLDGALLAFGPHPDALTYIGFSYRKLGQFDQAEQFYKEALAVDPNHRGATEYYGELKVERGDLTGAKVLLSRLDTICTFGCPEAEELRRWIVGGPQA